MEKVAFNEVGEHRCTGCFACYNSCKFDAIKMNLNEDGFFMPFIDDTKCKKCKICYKNCPVIEKSESDNSIISAYAAWNTDDSIRLKSSSGGVFSAIATYVIQDLQGVVYGATYESGIVRHIRVDEIEQLKLLRKSKYLPSYIGKSYENVKNDLDRGKYVLFVGTPCQVEAINKFIKNKDKLITCDLICHGVPSYTVFNSYLKSINMESKNIEIDFRNKENGWKNFRVILKDNNKNILYNTHHLENKFFKGFVDNLYLKYSCYDCKFCTTSRVGDITLGDFWGVSQENYNDLGVSLVIANNHKGLDIINTLNEKEQIIAQVVSNDELGENKRIYNGTYTVPKIRYEIKSFLKYNDFDKFYKKYIYKSYYKKVLGKIRRIIKI